MTKAARRRDSPTSAWPGAWPLDVRLERSPTSVTLTVRAGLSTRTAPEAEPCSARVDGSGACPCSSPKARRTRSQAKLRGQALDWLKSETREWAKFLDSAAPGDRQALLKAISEWETVPTLAGVRTPQALASLPEAERREWVALWAEVKALIERAKGKAP
jgi:hypothetical protein